MVNYSEFIEIVCSNLKITKPIVEEVLFLHTPTQLAEYVPADNALKYRMGKMPLDIMFAIAHELRHKWQAENCPEIFQDYVKSLSCYFKHSAIERNFSLLFSVVGF